MARRAKLPATEPALANETAQRAKPLRVGTPEDGHGTGASYEEVLVDIGDLDPYPTNPRLERDERTRDALAEDLSVFGFERRYALTVRRLPNGRMQIVGGHTRYEAALLAGLSRVWVRIFDWDDRTAAEQVLLDNRQRGATPMEIALHSLQMERDGHLVLAQGKAGEGLTAFARRVGLDPQNLRRYRRGASVALAVATSGVVTVGELRDRAEHLACIAELDEAMWPDLVRRCASEDWSVGTTRARVSGLLALQFASNDMPASTPEAPALPAQDAAKAIGAADAGNEKSTTDPAPVARIEPEDVDAGRSLNTDAVGSGDGATEGTPGSDNRKQVALVKRLREALVLVEIAAGAALGVLGPVDPVRKSCVQCGGTRFSASKREPAPTCVGCKDGKPKRGQTIIDTADVRNVYLLVAWSALVPIGDVRVEMTPVLVVERQRAIDFSTHDGNVLRTTDPAASAEDLRGALEAVLLEHAKKVMPEGRS